jgi:hypothetical protein
MKILQKSRVALCAATLLFLCLVSATASAQKLKTENVFLIMSDGLRWQEVFRGAEEELISSAQGVANTNALRSEFWRATEEERRQTLLPFFWKEIARNGQIFGNTNKGSVARLTNGKKFSYPGYNEVISGSGDPRINSNDKIPNPNTNVFEWLNYKPKYAKKVAIFGNWDAFPYIFNTERSGLITWPLWEEKFAKYKPAVAPEIEAIFRDTTPIWHNAATLDSFIYNGALNYVKSKQPKVMFLGLGETDEWAHGRRYDLYLSAAHNVDRYISELWSTVQSMPKYRNKTTFIITCDHGRGSEAKNWTDHGGWVPGAEDIWIAVLGPDTAPLGERANCAMVRQSQIAATLAAFLGEDFHAAFPKSGAAIAEVLGKTAK